MTGSFESYRRRLFFCYCCKIYPQSFIGCLETLIVPNSWCNLRTAGCNSMFLMSWKINHLRKRTIPFTKRCYSYSAAAADGGSLYSWFNCGCEMKQGWKLIRHMLDILRLAPWTMTFGPRASVQTVPDIHNHCHKTRARRGGSLPTLQEFASLCNSWLICWPFLKIATFRHSRERLLTATGMWWLAVWAHLVIYCGWVHTFTTILVVVKRLWSFNGDTMKHHLLSSPDTKEAAVPSY